jgi:protein-L-isoaspartate(D-aspartate) O-methyltransferase
MEPASHVDDRLAMVKKQLVRRGIRAPAVLAAMERVPRELFVPAAVAAEAYGDHAVTIDCGQTISQPYIVALMTEALELDGSHKVLEIGTGSGYQTAILAELAGSVISIERHGALSLGARRALEQLGHTNVRLLIGDGTRGYLPEAPFDRIIVTAAAEQVPEPLLTQLAEGGRLVIPLGSERSQVLQVLRKTAGELQTEELANCRFVPLIEG